MAKELIVLCLTLVLISSALGAAPTGCTYDDAYSSTGIYTCVFGSYTEPLTYSTFSSPLPQRLKITNLAGSLPTSGSAFSGFSSFSSGSFDANYPASLELVCTGVGTLTLSTGTFTDMGYLQEVKFTHCTVASLSSGMLSNFGSLNSLIFEYGGISLYTADFLTGLTIESLSVPDPKGEFVIIDCTVSPTAIPAGLFNPLTAAKIIRIENAGVTTVDKTAFSLAKKLNYISLSGNAITTLDNDLFDGLNSLSTINLEGLAYDCSCTNLGILAFAIKNSVSMPSRLTCNAPTAYQNKRAATYYSDSCVEVIPSCADVSLGSMCMSIYEIIGNALMLVALIISGVALGLICHTRRQLMTAVSGMEKKRNGSWAKVRDAMNKTDFSDKKPPMKGTETAKNGGWM